MTFVLFKCRRHHQRQIWPRRMLTLSLLLSFASHCLSDDAAGASKNLTYQFTLLAGHELAVCNAYLERLNTAKYTSPPYCDIPENDAVQGFAKLNRVKLTRDEGVQLWSHVISFTINQNQALNSDGWPSSMAEDIWGTGITAWRYDPPVSMNNNNHSDNVLIWQGPGASVNPSANTCGGELTNGNHQFIYRAPQSAYILTQDNKQIDENLTRELFGRPGGARPPNPYEPIAPIEGLFTYRGMYYLYAVDDGTKGNGTDKPRFNSIFRVFLRQSGRTRKMCEYGMVERSSRPR